MPQDEIRNGRKMGVLKLFGLMAEFIWTETSPNAVEGQLTERKAGRLPHLEVPLLEPEQI